MHMLLKHKIQTYQEKNLHFVRIQKSTFILMTKSGCKFQLLISSICWSNLICFSLIVGNSSTTYPAEYKKAIANITIRRNLILD